MRQKWDGYVIVMTRLRIPRTLNECQRYCTTEKTTNMMERSSEKECRTVRKKLEEELCQGKVEWRRLCL